MNLGQLDVGVVVFAIVVFALLTGGMGMPETPVPADDANRSTDTDMTEPDADDIPPENSNLGTEQEPVVADDDGAGDLGNNGTINKSENGSGTFETVGTGDDGIDLPTRTTRLRDSPVGVSDYSDGDGDDGSSGDSSSDNPADDSLTDDSTDDVSSDGSTDDAGDDTDGDSGGGSSGGDSGGDIRMCTV